MADEHEQRWDDEVERAWRAFRRDLGDRLVDLSEGEDVVLAAHPGEHGDDRVPPSCLATATAEGDLALEVVADPALSAVDRVGTRGALQLRVLGFAPPLEVEGGEPAPAHRARVPRREADRAAWMLAEAMRRVHGVLHPALLDRVRGASASPSTQAGGQESDPSTWAVRDEHWPTDDHGPWFPDDAEDVRRALHRVAREVLGDEPTWDDDDDLCLTTEHARVWVVVARALPRVLMTCTLLTEVVDESRALVETTLLNRRHFGLTFLLDDGRLVVRRELPVSAFQPTEVRAEMARLLEHVDRWVVELRDRVGGRGMFDEAPAAPLGERGAGTPAGVDEAQQRRFAAAQAVMRELEREERGSADPATLARVYHHDRSLVMLAVAATREREAEDRRRAERHQEAERAALARRYRARARYERELRSRLRRALRITVQAGQRSETAEQPGLFAEEDVRG